jgi:hypothetical protein
VEVTVNERRSVAMVTLREAYTTLEMVPQARAIVQGQIGSVLQEM